MTVARRTQALLDVVEDDRRARCAGIAAEADARAQAALRDAHREARERMRDTFAEERRRAAEHLAAARAKLATRRRHAGQQRAAVLLEAGLARLPATLARRWDEPDTRRAWIDAILAHAGKVLPHGTWRIGHPVTWDPTEARALGERIAAVAGAVPQFAPDARIAAGLRVATAGIVVDGTLAGLLADRATIGSRLLGVLESPRSVTPRHG